ncbi:DUF4254 domain-containing protein [Terriglobus aquaticus]|uniref:DUF4254 domain-containing protein n=1 Tax=Terriglobus aquaticus TaxID=940139 RepID=A0ABW9KL48_9BACT|nr:DUF4254 domain-containing protein [Terriglobus aquaticus]
MLQEPDAADLKHGCADAPATSAALNAATARWHLETAAPRGLIFQLHLANFELWHLEDKARDTTNGDALVAETKRAIDRVNQRRNDTVEAIDTALLALLAPRNLPAAAAPLHSETPGQMLDRLSILALKRYHTAVESKRDDATPEHRDRSLQRLSALEEQERDLASCLQTLWREVEAGTRRFKLYRQMKMYNDPTLNPVLYAAAKKS